MAPFLFIWFEMSLANEKYSLQFLNYIFLLLVSPHQRDKSYAVNSAITAKEYIKKLCKSFPCVDTITLYLTGPSKSDGSLLFWDNGNGLTDDSELYSPKELLEDVKNCTARRLFIVADYSYSGAMINKIKSRMERHPRLYRNLVAISSTSWNQSSWRSDFTDAFVKQSKEGTTTKCVTDVVEVITLALIVKFGFRDAFYSECVKYTTFARGHD